MARWNSVRLKANFGQTLTDSDNIEGFTPTNGKTVRLPGVGAVYCYVDTTPDYSQGKARVDMAGGVSYSGLESCTYTQPRMHRNSLTWLRSNYQGQVTVYLTKDGTSYARYNAYLEFSQNPRINANAGDWFDNVEWKFFLIGAAL
jgi:hypothetical protein